MSNYVRIPVQRGWQRVSKLHDDIAPLGAYISGGYARWMASTSLNESIKQWNAARPQDIDIFCVDRASYSNVKALFSYRGLKPFAESQWARTYQGYGTGLPIQLIKPMPGDKCIDDYLERFDFSVCRAVIVNSDVAYVDHQFEQHEADRQLAIRNFDQLTIYSRLAKYLTKGYSLNQLDMLRVLTLTKMNRELCFDTERQEQIAHVIGHMRSRGLAERGVFVDEFRDIYSQWINRFNNVEEKESDTEEGISEEEEADPWL